MSPIGNWFKKAGNSIKGAFSKGGALDPNANGLANAFKKGGEIQQGLTTGLKDVAGVLGKVGQGITTATNNPIVKAIGSYIPMGNQILGTARTIGSGLNQSSQFINPSTYKGNTLENLKDAAMRAKSIAVTAAPLFV